MVSFLFELNRPKERLQRGIKYINYISSIKFNIVRSTWLKDSVLVKALPTCVCLTSV
jgi:hypothetical protein